MTAIAIQAGGKSCERALFSGERDLFVRIVAFSLMFAGSFDMLQSMKQMAVRNHGVVSGFLKLSLHVLLSGFQVLLGGLFEMVMSVVT